MSEIQNPYEIALKDGFSVEQGFNVCLLFYNYLWPVIKPRVEALGEEAFVVHKLFFLDVCMGFECSGDWNEAIYLETGVHKEAQKIGFKLSEQKLLSCTAEFCKLYNEIFKGQLGYILQILESMEANPDSYPVEWPLWKKALIDSYTTFIVDHFDWDGEPYRKS